MEQSILSLVGSCRPSGRMRGAGPDRGSARYFSSHLTIGKPIDPTEYGTKRIVELVATVREAIVRPLPEELSD